MLPSQLSHLLASLAVASCPAVMSYLFDTPLSLDSSETKWARAMQGSLVLAQMVERGDFLPAHPNPTQREEGKEAADRFTNMAAFYLRKDWEQNPRSTHSRERMLFKLEKIEPHPHCESAQVSRGMIRQVRS